MSVPFDKKLAELDAYLQMLIAENELLDEKLMSASGEQEIEGLLNIKNNLETLLGSIKHAIVLLQIAKVSLRRSSSESLSTPPRIRRDQTKASGGQSAILRTSTSKSISGSSHNSSPLSVTSRSSCSQNKQTAVVPQKHRADLSTTSTIESNSQQIPSIAHQAGLPSSPHRESSSSEAAVIAADRPSGGSGGGGCASGRRSGSTASSTAKPPNQTDYAEGDDEDDDDDAFFDAADVQQQQQNRSNSIGQQQQESQKNATNSQLDKENLTAMAPPTPQTGDNINNNNPISNDNIDWDALYEDEDEDELGSLEGHGSVIKHLLSQIRIGMDLTKVVLPTFILERRSLLEMYADFFAHPDLFSAIPSYETSEDRIIQLVRWYLSAFHAGRKSSLAKKPYNPILGEIFRCRWNLANSQSSNTRIDNLNDNSNVEGGGAECLTFVAEQVSHHPPVSAFYAENRDKSISCCAHIYTKSKYLGLSVGVHNIGQGVIKLLKHNETYVCTFPSAYGRSILTVPWVELGGSVSITCQETGYSANIEFVTKPFYGGKKHRVMGEILRPNKEPIMTIDGEWNGVMYSKCPPSSSGEKQVFVDTTNLPVIKKHVGSISSQESFESRNVWKEVTRALKFRDVTNATAAKSFIEQKQRDLLKDRLEKGIKWKTRFFEACDDGWTFSEPLEVAGRNE